MMENFIFSDADYNEISVSAEVMGETVKFTPKDTDKKLVEHLLKGCELEAADDVGEGSAA